MGRLPEVVPLVAGLGAVDLAAVKSNFPGVFVGVLKYRKRFMELGRRSVDNMDADVPVLAL